MIYTFDHADQYGEEWPMNNASKDLRGYLGSIQDRLKPVRKSVDVLTQLPALCSQSSDPLLFENLNGYGGWRLADRLLGDRELQALALACAPDAVIPHYAAATATGPGMLSDVADGPVKEIIWSGAEADLTRLPVPVPSEGIDVPHMDLKAEDFRSPVISGSVAITRHPESGVQNCFFTMAKVVGSHRAHCYVFSPHTWENIAAWTLPSSFITAR